MSKLYRADPPLRTTACIVGPLDIDHAADDRRTLLAALDGRSRLLIDLSAVGRIDSAGLAVLVEVGQAARKQGKAFVLTGINEAVMRVMRLARLDRAFTILNRDRAHPGGTCHLG
ncbi:MAG: anti-sigma factor antagonist [Rhodospirillales bacterium CG15_BIG_FIL_POST_REV_8_21_14_020_66_15]|nr:MAG: anti-sigma factor antagonist [Rhodospirillales bacterium CG15_BIG_FIL_POST_REV_8_21_14_020_66_15]